MGIGAAVRPKERRKIVPDGPKIGQGKDDPAKDNQQQGIEALHHTGGFLQRLLQPHLFDDENDTVVKPPQQEVPAGAMPQAGQPPHDDEIQNLSGQAAPVAAQRDIHILPEPGSQRNMPPPPVFGNAAAQIRVIEVFQELKAQHFSQPNGHIGIAGKVKVNLEGKGDGAQPGRPGGKTCPRQRRHGIPQGAHLVRDEHLFPQAYGEPSDARGKLRRCFPAVRELFLHRFVLHDGPCDELREQRDIGAKGDGILLCRHGASVYINDIAERLEGVKADTDGQRQLQQRNFAAGDIIYGAN